MTLKIAVIGAGIVGITSTCRILEHFPNANITVYADRFSPNTTSDVSAGLLLAFQYKINTLKQMFYLKCTFKVIGNPFV